MTTAPNLLEFILNLLRDSDAKAAFIANPDQALADAGLGDVCCEDVSDAMSYVAEYHPVSFVGNREYHLGNTNVPQHADSDWPDHGYRPGYGPEPHASAVHQLEYITTNYAYTDSHDTVIDKSVNQNIWNQGTLAQRFDDHSVTATDHSMAAGRDVNGDLANGNDNVLGEGNNVGNTTHYDDHFDDHSLRDSFNGDNIADHGGVAGHDNDGNATDPHNSNVATDGSALENSPRTSQDTAIRDSYNDSHNRESNHSATLDSGNDNSYHTTTNSLHHESFNNHQSFNHQSFNHQSFNDESFNHDINNHESDNHDSAITHTDQHGLINAN
ncbi:MAG TPA: IniB N-terminal domain-containing protein, partial [Pseudonocardiaceae bacterium]|nr:IniB N-terminal domain-containing protein [Pseudonocardiaceae bacterium]